MATNKSPLDEDDIFPATANDGELDQAIDDLRGVLKADSEGTAPDFGAEFGAGAETAASFGGEFGGEFAGSPMGEDFGGNDFGTTGFGGSSAAMQEPGSALTSNLDLIMDIPITVEIVLGTSKMQVSGLMELQEGAIIALDKRIGEPVEITVNGRRIAKGEITVLENDDTRFGVKLTEVLSTKKI
ncbi:flagellar motor switch protein FliN [Rhizobium sp. SSA_523]|uniref:flagellar motor switch protein FliN n=1 Tax=Rhizobium sp. SSA_523 TaxID=2952477 RepID=UPI0020916E71|nr:flagellar motor switch protein FliN [Rhizobium sp. SSA_523]MCO5732993.1 flagellar motor switch protein FliN [Rhizobium sp. SSA_523]WKC23877.1 flagellar motor switch protein FliN [Rhizobium sp. SSA_523]